MFFSKNCTKIISNWHFPSFFPYFSPSFFLWQGEDGSLFRVDFGFVFGATPEIDSPQTVVARAVTYALGVERWMEVVAACALDFTGPNTKIHKEIVY